MLGVDDLLTLVDAASELIVAGTGTTGRMGPEADVSPFLKERGIDCITEPTPRAVDIYNGKITTGIEGRGLLSSSDLLTRL